MGYEKRQHDVEAKRLLRGKALGHFGKMEGLFDSPHVNISGVITIHNQFMVGRGPGGKIT